MAVKNKTVLKKLKKQVSVLKRKENKSKNKLKATLKRLRKLTKAYKAKLALKIRFMKSRIGEAQAATYAKVASDIQRQMLKNIDAKGKSLKSAISKLEKKHISKLTKGIVKKGKATGKSRKKVKSRKGKTKKVKRTVRRTRRYSRR